MGEGFGRPGPRVYGLVNPKVYEVVSSFKNFGRSSAWVGCSLVAQCRSGADALRMFVSVRRPESLSLSLAVLASLSEVIMDQILLENSVPKVRELVADRVGIRIARSALTKL